MQLDIKGEVKFICIAQEDIFILHNTIKSFARYLVFYITQEKVSRQITKDLYLYLGVSIFLI